MQFAPRLSTLVSIALSTCFATAFWGCGSGQAASRGDSFDSQRAWGHLEKLVSFGDRSLGQPGLEATRVYLTEQLRAAGLEPQREDFTERTPLLAETAFANIYADLPAVEGAPLVILMTHFDAKSFAAPGAPQVENFQAANDGGSGTAVLLELARTLSGTQELPKVRYRFLFVDGEESTRWSWAGTDNTYGSRYHVRQLLEAKQLDSVKAVVLLDMVGDASLKLNREGHSTKELLKIFFDAAQSAGLGQHVGGPARFIEDDHKSFLAHGIPAVDLIDFSYGPANRYWHDEKDTLEHCSRESLDAIGRIVLAGLPQLEEFALRH